MNNDIRYTMLSDWGVCELRDGRCFLSGKVIDDPINPERLGDYITTSLIVSPRAAIADGNVVATEDGQYLLVDRYRVDDVLFAKLDAWIDAQPVRPTLGEVLATGDRELIAAFITRGFRRAAAEAAWSQKEG